METTLSDGIVRLVLNAFQISLDVSWREENVLFQRHPTCCSLTDSLRFFFVTEVISNFDCKLGGAFKSPRQPMLKSPNAERLTEYYQKYFPVEELVYCLSKCSPLYLREFSFTLQNNVYTRFRSFETSHQLKEELCRITPLKIDVGAVYSASPEQRKSIPEDKFRAIFRELVFDLDISDYDDIRFCCK